MTKKTFPRSFRKPERASQTFGWAKQIWETKVGDVNPESESRVFRTAILVVNLSFVGIISGALCGCGYKARQKSDELDSLLIQSNRITQIEIGTVGIPLKKDILEKERAESVLGALNKTNRVKQSSSGKTNIKGWIKLQNGTNELLVIEIYDDGVLAYDEYTFGLLSPINYSVPDQLPKE